MTDAVIPRVGTSPACLRRVAAAALAIGVLLACTGQPPPEEPTEPTGDVAQPTAATPRDTTKTYPDWDPSQPVDTKTLSLRTMYVVVEQSAVCPTREAAEARSCGHSVEDVSKGVRARQGTGVTVVGDAPLEGQWKALRFQKAGVLPAWIMADDVAATPKPTFLDAFDGLPDVAKAKDAGSMSGKDLARVAKGILVKWRRTRGLKRGSFAGTVMIYIEGDAPAAVELPPPSENNRYVENHDCLLNGDCPTLDYVCDDAYCDEVSILARATGNVAESPDMKPIPHFEGIAIADRFGVFPTPAK